MKRFFRRPRRFPPRQRHGIILFVVTVVIAALALGGMSLLALMRVELEATRHRLDDLDLENTVRSAAALTVALSGMTPGERARLGGIYDNRFLVKITTSAKALMPNAPLELPYDGAKEMLLVEDLDNKDFLNELFNSMIDELPAPKKKK